ncbi:MAG: tRNA 2-thiouridine(34) synthase MnmA [Peptostreptococcaceae bacterium]|nr:tRNA 2-thiouridine(34) synthase MnmA [Peptostreptococcaceae bacterium]
MTKKVLVGMSGGVDSAVAAALLIDQGYDVIGVTLNLWDGKKKSDCNTGKTCCSLEDVEDARAVAYHLGIPFYVLNMKELFKEKVVDYFIDSYLKGETPNPCVACNQYIKFDAMLEKAISLGCDYISTGHYARKAFNSKSGRFLLKKAADPSKDQSYVLYMLKQNQLERLLFPLGDLKKTDTRNIAKEKGLRVFEKPDSQDICFVETGKYGDFIREHTHREIPDGLFVDREGNVLGRHKGIINYTIGQRKGLGLAVDSPYYVVEKDVLTNTVILAHKADTLIKTFTARDMNYISFEQPKSEFKAEVRVRYSSKESAAVIFPMENNRARIEFVSPQQFVAPGQIVVLYDNDNVIGGGIIER